MSVLDGQIANTALPTIARDLGSSPVESIWVVNAFQLAVTATLLSFAALGELRGPGGVYRAGVIMFVAGSLCCALARSLPLLIAARAFQGIGASAILSISPAILREVFPRRQLGRALGLNALVVATSAAAGPTIGGFILAVLPWPWLFAINVPFGLANIALNRALPPDHARKPGWLDLPSVVTSALGFALVIWGLDGFARHEPGWSIALRIAAGLASAAFFVRRQFALPRPMIALDLFRIPPFSMAAATSFASFTSQGIAFVALPFFFQEALGHTPLESGFAADVVAARGRVVAPFAGRLSDRFPVGILATAGLAVFTVGLALYAMLPPNPPARADRVARVVCGLGYGFFQSPNNRELIGSAPRSKSGSAAGLLATFRLGGQTLGASLVAIVFGAFGASLASGPQTHGLVSHAVPAVLWVACACAGVATVASGLRLFVLRGPRSET